MWQYGVPVYLLFINFKKSYDSVRREVLYNILIELGVPMKLVRLIKMFLLWVNASCCVVTMNKYKNSLFVTK
jgi:hypothetical protein